MVQTLTKHFASTLIFAYEIRGAAETSEMALDKDLVKRV